MIGPLKTNPQTHMGRPTATSSSTQQPRAWPWHSCPSCLRTTADLTRPRRTERVFPIRSWDRGADLIADGLPCLNNRTPGAGTAPAFNDLDLQER